MAVNKGLVSTLLACLLLIAAVNAQTASIGVSGGDTVVDVGTWTEYFFLTASELPQSSVTVSLNEATGTVQINPSTVSLAGARQASFRVLSNTIGAYTIDFTINGDSANQFFTNIGSVSVSFAPRQITIDDFPDFTYIGESSEPLKITVSTAPVSGSLSFSFNPDNSAITFSPNPVVIPQGAVSASFTFSGTDIVTTDIITIDVTGNEAALYDTDTDNLPAGFQYNIIYREFTTPDVETNVLVSQSDYNGMYVYVRRPVTSGSLTIKPQAADTVFNPASATLDSTHQYALFTFNTSSWENGKSVYFFPSGSAANYYAPVIDPVSIQVPQRQVSVTVSSTYIVANVSFMSIVIPAPVATSLTVNYWAANVKFNLTSVTFTGNTTSYTVSLSNAALGPDTISFRLTGPDAQLYEEIGDIDINGGVIRGNFIGPDEWYIPALWVGVESDKIPIRASISPVDTVTLTPTAPNLKFNPTTLTFRNGTEQQFFTITPLYTNAFSESVPTSYSTTIDWLISGASQDNFDIPASFDVTVNQRYIQVAWSSHLNTDDLNSEDTENTRHLHKTYKVWASVSFAAPGDQVSVTPTSPYFSFKPAVLFFDNSNTRIEFEATVTGVAPGGDATIDYIIGGKDGGLYNPPSSDTWTTAIRPLKIVAAVVSPDERSKGVLIADNYTRYGLEPQPTPYYRFNTGVLSSYHVHSFLIRSFVLPDKSLTITPHCPHVTFSPSHITIHAKNAVKRFDYHPTISQDIVYYFNVTGVYLEANFTAKAQAAGTHVVWFELTGDDAPYYDVPDHQPMTFNLVMRPSSEPFRISSSSYLFPSFLVVALMAAFALVM